jgi:hypothetical protein
MGLSAAPDHGAWRRTVSTANRPLEAISCLRASLNNQMARRPFLQYDYIVCLIEVRMPWQASKPKFFQMVIWDAS